LATAWLATVRADALPALQQYEFVEAGVDGRRHREAMLRIDAAMTLWEGWRRAQSAELRGRAASSAET